RLRCGLWRPAAAAAWRIWVRCRIAAGAATDRDRTREGLQYERGHHVGALPVGWALSRDRTRGDVDHQRHEGGVVDERDDAVHGRGAADGLVGDADVGDLGGHADHEGEID